MKEFALQHPWLFFWLVICALMVTDSVWENWCNRNKPVTPNCSCEGDE